MLVSVLYGDVGFGVDVDFGVGLVLVLFSL